MILRALLWILLIYFLYRFIFDFLLPVFQVSRKMKQQVDAFRRQQDNMSGQQQKRPEEPAPSQNGGKAGEYIDFEEIRE